MNEDPHVRVTGLDVILGERKILDRVALTVVPGEILVIMGRSGCGKTTLLKTMVGLLPPDEGTVEVLGRDVASLDEDALDEFRERIGMLFQFGALISSFTVGENILLPLRRRSRVDETTARAVAQMKLSMVGLPHVFDLHPSQLSGGMKKRAGFARALILDPDIIFFDEPTSGLDPNTAADMDQLILSQKRMLGTTMVVVTHDLASAFTIADRIIVMHDGRLVAEGTAAELQASSVPEVRDFVERRRSREEEKKEDDGRTFFR